MKPLCEKVYIGKIIEIVTLLFGVFADIAFIMHHTNDIAWLILIIIFTSILIVLAIDIIYWFFQPRVLIHQYETGIIIHRKIKIEYTSIESIKYKNHVEIKKWGNYSRDASSGIIIIKLKSGKIYKIRNVFYPIDAVDVLSKIKKQRKFK